MKSRHLSLLSPGESAVVQQLLCRKSICRRLRALGLIEGTRIRCLQKSPMGDPTAFSVRGAVIAIRRQDASDIIIQ